MPPAQTISGILLRGAPRKDSYTRWELFTRHGGLQVVMLPQKLALPFGPFDHLELSATSKGKNLFATEIRLLDRPHALAKSPRGFMEAGRLAGLMAKAFSHMPDYREVYDIFAKALAHYRDGQNATLVTLKAFYLMLQAEGFPAKESWLSSLPHTQQAVAQKLLTDEVTPGDSSPDTEKTLQSLITWASGELGVKLVFG